MHGIINHFRTRPGQRAAAMESMLRDVGPLKGCLSFVVAEDLTDPDAFWMTEVWSDKEAHAASLQRPGVKESIDILVPLIADWGTEVVTRPVGGIGLKDHSIA